MGMTHLESYTDRKRTTLDVIRDKMKLRTLLSPLPPEPQKRGKRVSGNPAAVPLPPGGRLIGWQSNSIRTANIAHLYNFV